MVSQSCWQRSLLPEKFERSSLRDYESLQERQLTYQSLYIRVRIGRVRIFGGRDDLSELAPRGKGKFTASDTPPLLAWTWP